VTIGRDNFGEAWVDQLAEKKVTDVVIAGGGLTGAAAAIAFARCGIDATVVEALPHTPVDKWGLMLWPTGIRVLRNLGLTAVDDLGCRLDALKWFVERYRHWIGADLRQAAGDAAFIGVSPSRLQQTVTAEAKRLGVSFICPGEVVAVEHETPGRMRIVVSNSATGTQDIRCRGLVVANGVASQLRAQVGIKAWIWRARAQSIVTGIGGAVPFAESRQAFGDRWSAGCVPLDKDHTWLYAVIPSTSRIDARSAVERYADVDSEAASAVNSLGPVHTVQPTSVRVARWANEGCVALGDSAHGMFPYLGLGGNANLEDIPVLAEVMKHALRNRANQPLRLWRLQRRRQARVRYLRRVSEEFSLCLTSGLPAVALIRDWNFRRLAKRPHLLQNFLREVAAGGVPSLGTRAAILLP
jgi:2-polyprenyl-6-methoxyphenol hydroxylase-like FAD-dependent oxidoreductase